MIGGGLKPITMPSRKSALSAAKAGARLRASSRGSVRSDQSLRETKDTPALVFCAPDSRSKPAIVTTLSTAGFCIAPSVTCAVIPIVRSSDAAGGSIVTRNTEP